MQPILPTTPHGPRALSRAMVEHQIAAKACPAGARVNKWKVLNAIRVAAPALALTATAIRLLGALLSFHPGDELVVGQNLIVFPSNRSLAGRADMSESSVTRGLPGLVQPGMILRRDSPNGKRYARKGQGGAIQQAFGFDLTPLVARAAEFQGLAAEVEQERQELKHLRQAISINQREIRKTIDAAVDDGIPGDWAAFDDAPFAHRISRSISLAAARILAGALDQLAAEIRNQVESHVKKTDKMRSNAAQNEQHIQNTNKNHKIESEPGLPISEGETSEPHAEPPRPPHRSYPLGMILEACPDIAAYARNGIASWPDLVATAAHVRSMLGISPSAWEDAKNALGPDAAAILVAAILQRGTAITNAGGYLRSLTEKARAGTFSLGPMLMALIRTNLSDRSRKSAFHERQPQSLRNSLPARAFGDRLPLFFPSHRVGDFTSSPPTIIRPVAPDAIA